MSLRRFIALIGPMGAGKSTVGAELARELDVDLYDTDAMVEAAADLSVTQIFEHEGEQGFRLRESEALVAALGSPTGVVACGGGLVSAPANRELLAERCQVIYLRVTPEVAAARLGPRDPNRPLLAGAETVVTLSRITNEREAIYRAVCDHEVDGDADLSSVVASVISVIG